VADYIHQLQAGTILLTTTLLSRVVKKLHARETNNNFNSQFISWSGK